MEIVEAGPDIDAFVKQPLEIYAGDPFYPTPIFREMRKHLTPENPFFDHAEVRFFLAMEGGRPLGRIASVVNHNHIGYHGEKAGFFGFFECVEDAEAARALLDRAAGVLADRGMRRMLGPMSFSTNDECGMLVEGFEEPPILMTPYNPPYYPRLMEACGMRKAKDLYAYIYEVGDALPGKVLNVAEAAEGKGIRARPLRMRDFRSEMRIFQEVYNSAWSENWGFVPITDGELDYMAGKLREAMVPELTLIAEAPGGEPVGFMGLIPDFNLVLRHLHGRLNPLTAMKALYYSKRITDLRLLLLGVKKEYRLRGIEALLFREGFKGIKKGHYRRVELSWILEDNFRVMRLAEMFDARHYKTFRIYERGL
ncbi:MAG: hypothetical protein Kow0025_20550 [Thermodesulfovibrionales bacterium]